MSIYIYHLVFICFIVLNRHNKYTLHLEIETEQVSQLYLKTHHQRHMIVT